MIDQLSRDTVDLPPDLPLTVQRCEMAAKITGVVTTTLTFLFTSLAIVTTIKPTSVSYTVSLIAIPVVSIGGSIICRYAILKCQKHVAEAHGIDTQELRSVSSDALNEDRDYFLL